MNSSLEIIFIKGQKRERESNFKKLYFEFI